ncbi:transcriptional repressor [Cetobacterium somerae]|uniref:Fur family transcriptional regulator n=1 Tax=Cetobacterium somerae TaxID=188913 RepID=UPI002E7B7DCB|nr:transcriptional repressor [Cetobacterium somerae]WVJ00728.1 transcriptional repressor [Cetobacterium somerae]
MKFSKQRELILNYILNSHEHLTADTIYADLKKDNPELSLGTVYRNLTKLTEIGAIKKVSLPNQVDKFDKNLEPHAHFICDECGSITDINIPGMDKFLDKVSDEDGISIRKYDLTLNGTCKKCKDKK